MDEEKVEKKKAGRPKGSKNESIEVDVQPCSCPKCGSTARGVYTGTNRHMFVSGVYNGVYYTSITWRRCKCAKCGQARIEKTYHTA